MRRRAFDKFLAILLTVGAPCAIGAPDVYGSEQFVISSSAIASGRLLSKKFAGRGGPRNCQGDNVSPPLQWKNPPKGTRSFIIVVVDMDGVGEPNGAGLVHWIAYGIPASTMSLAEGQASSPSKKFMTGRNTLGMTAYYGPCPQVPGDKPHEYVFSVTAVSLDPGALQPGLSYTALRDAIGKYELNGVSISVRYAGEGK